MTESTATRTTTRARALPPQERREALILATLGLLRDNGEVPSTRQIAQAAGVAEGTIFRAFDSKEELLDAVVAHIFDPEPVRADLDAVDADLPLRERLIALVTLLQRRFTDVFGVMKALGMTAPPRPAAGADASERLRRRRDAAKADECEPGEDSPGDHPMYGRFQRLIAPAADEISVSPAKLARYLRLLTFSGSHPEITDGELLTPEEIVDVILDGVRRKTL